MILGESENNRRKEMGDDRSILSKKIYVDPECDVCARHYVDGVAYQATDGQFGTYLVLAVTICEGCLGIRAEGDGEHVWVPCSKVVYPIYKDTHGNYSAKAWIDTPITVDGAIPNPSEKCTNEFYCDPSAPDPDPAHCINNSCDLHDDDQAEGDPKYTKKRALKRYMLDVILGQYGGAYADLPILDPDVPALETSISVQRNSDGTTEFVFGGDTWVLNTLYVIRRSAGLQVAGMSPHFHPPYFPKPKSKPRKRR
jgi:hypothetical protein